MAGDALIERRDGPSGEGIYDREKTSTPATSPLRLRESSRQRPRMNLDLGTYRLCDPSRLVGACLAPGVEPLVAWSPTQSDKVTAIRQFAVDAARGAHSRGHSQ